MLSIFYGILSAATWGAGDFIGGLASKRTSPYRVLFLAEIAGMVPFTILAILLREPIPSTNDMLLGAGSSLIGLGGLLFLYQALASSQMTIAAPVSALFAALIPVIFGIFTLGIPSSPTLIGFALAFAAVWFISQTDMSNWRFSLRELRLPLLSGLFFGLYFLILHRATLNAFFWLAQGGLALPGALIDRFFGPRLIRAEVVVGGEDHRFEQVDGGGAGVAVVAAADVQQAQGFPVAVGAG